MNAKTASVAAHSFCKTQGTGKSFALKEAIRAAKRVGRRVFVTASTGAAATQIGGQTIHAFAGVGHAGESAADLARHVASSYKAKKRWLACETLVIDEISMLDAATFDKLDHVARYVRGNDKPFGGVQLLCCGDFLQLPPVSARGGFAFEAKCWRRCFPEQRALTRVFRQSGDDAFLQILGELRIAKLSNKSAALLRRLKHTDLSEWTSRGIEPTRLQCYNADVDSINEARLKALKTSVEHLPCVDKGDGERYARHHPYASTLKLKIGAQVMLLSNLDVSAGLANGARGVVEEFVRAPSRAVDGVIVRWASGKTTTVDRDAKTVEEGGREVFSRSQFPLRLAWAVTIHKAQGQTLDLLEVDLRGCREFGQAYVAVSRATAMKKLRVLNFDPSVVRAHPRAVEYVDRLLSRDPRAVYEDEAAANPVFAPANDDGWISTKTKAPPSKPPPRRGPPQPVQRGPPAVAPRAGPPPVAKRVAPPPAPKRAGPPPVAKRAAPAPAPRTAKRPAPAPRITPSPPPPARQTIPGKRVMLVGVLTQSRPRASSRVAAAGGTVVKTVDESVSYVVVGDSLADGRPVECSASYQNAERLGIKLMSEQQFFAML